MNRKFILKMLQAKKMEIEAIKELIPENTEQHFKTIKSEIREIVKEWILSEGVFDDLQNEKSNEEADEISKKKTGTKAADKKVQKIKIES